MRGTLLPHALCYPQRTQGNLAGTSEAGRDADNTVNHAGDTWAPARSVYPPARAASLRLLSLVV